MARNPISFPESVILLLVERDCHESILFNYLQLMITFSDGDAPLLSQLILDNIAVTVNTGFAVF